MLRAATCFLMHCHQALCAFILIHLSRCAQAAQLREILTRLGPAFVKIGQVSSNEISAGFEPLKEFSSHVRQQNPNCRTKCIYHALLQAVSSRPDVAPPSYTMELEKLQDQIPPFPTEEAIAVMREDLAVSPSTLFSYLSEEPVAAASLGQVHIMLDFPLATSYNNICFRSVMSIMMSIT